MEETEEIICPHCDRLIADPEALTCYFCGESLARPIGVFGKLRYGAAGFVFLVVMLAVLLSFFLIKL